MLSSASRMMARRAVAAVSGAAAPRFAARNARFLSSVPPAPTSNHQHQGVANASAQIIYTETDEAPALATYSLLPVIAKVRISLCVYHCCCPLT